MSTPLLTSHLLSFLQVCAARGVFLSEPLWLAEFRSLLELDTSSSLSHQLEALTLEVFAATGAPHCGCQCAARGCKMSYARLSPLPPRTPSPGASSAEDGSMESAEEAAGPQPAAGVVAGWGDRGASDVQLEEPSAPPSSADAVPRIQQAVLRMLAAAGRNPDSQDLQSSGALLGLLLSERACHCCANAH